MRSVWRALRPTCMCSISLLVQPDFRGELGGIVNVESLMEVSGQIRDGGELDAKLVRDRLFRLA
jgi:hypothetical protein